MRKTWKAAARIPSPWPRVDLIGSAKSVMVKGVLGDAVPGGDGTYFNLPGVAVVTWDATSNAVYIETQGWSASAETEAALEAGLRAMTEHHGSRWLVDGSNMKVVKQSDQDWIDRKWLPHALAAGLRRVAMVIPKSGLALMNVEDMVRRIPSTKMDVAYFATVDEAREWLAGPPPKLRTAWKP